MYKLLFWVLGICCFGLSYAQDKPASSKPWKITVYYPKHSHTGILYSVSDSKVTILKDNEVKVYRFDFLHKIKIEPAHNRWKAGLVGAVSGVATAIYLLSKGVQKREGEPRAMYGVVVGVTMIPLAGVGGVGIGNILYDITKVKRFNLRHYRLSYAPIATILKERALIK